MGQIKVLHRLGHIRAEKYELEQDRSKKVLARLRRWIAEAEEISVEAFA
jgi:hypothetical protein